MSGKGPGRGVAAFPSLGRLQDRRHLRASLLAEGRSPTRSLPKAHSSAVLSLVPVSAAFVEQRRGFALGASGSS